MSRLRTRPIPALFCMVLFFLCCRPGNAMVLVRDGRSACTLVLGTNASSAERRAAEELVEVIERISGARIPIERPAGLPETGAHILLGKGSWLSLPRYRECAETLDVVGGQGYVVQVVDGGVAESLVIAGGGPLATRQAVHTLLRALGVRWFAPGVTRLPHHRSVSVSPDDLSDFPCFAYREIDPGGTNVAADWREHLRLSNGSGDDTTGREYVPLEMPLGDLLPESLFAGHPENLPLIRGARTSEFGLCCFTRPRTAAVVADGIMARLRNEPGFTHVLLRLEYPGVSCRCPACERMAAREGDAGLALYWMNMVAERLAARKSPAILVFSDPWTSGPSPKTIRPRDNVAVRLRAGAFGFSPEGAAGFDSACRHWTGVSERVHLVLPFVPEGGAPLPFRGLDDLALMLVKYRNRAVEGVFFEPPYPGVYVADAEFRMWLLSELLWNADISPDTLTREWARGVCGGGYGPFLELREHIGRFPEGSPGSNGARSGAGDRWLADAERIAQRADALSLSAREGNRLVRKARLGIWRLRLESVFEAARNGNVPDAAGRAKYLELLDRLGREMRECGFDRVSRGEGIDDFSRRIRAALRPGAGSPRTGGR